VNTNDSDEGSVAYSLTCTVATLPPVYSSAPAPLGATIPLYTSVGIATSTTLAVNNVGPAAAGGLTIATSGLSPPLSVSPASVGTPGIARGATQTLTITCLPSTAGATVETLVVTSNDPSAPPARYGIRCAALAPEFAAVPVPGSTITLNAPRGGNATASIRIDNPTLAAGTLQVDASGLSGLLSIAPPSAAIPPPNVPPSIAYAPAPGGTVTLTNGAASIAASSNLDGSGTFAPATTTVSNCAIAGAGVAAFDAPSLVPSPIAFEGVTLGSGVIALSCARGAASASATLTCDETRGAAPATQRQWPLVCPSL